MKKKKINTGVADILLVELPEGAYMVNINTHSLVGLHYMLYEDGVNTPYKERLPNGKWTILSHADEVTEEQATTLFKCVWHHTTLDRIFEDFTYYTDNPITSDRVFKTALESLDSLYEANGVYWENPYKDPGLMPSAELDIYRKAQQNVWDKSRTYILIKQK